MLNELRALEQGLAAYEVATVPRHPDVKETAKGDVIRVRLDATGAIANLELLTKDRPALWTLRKGQHNGFPGLKTGFKAKNQPSGTGLLELSADDRDAHDRAWRDARTPGARRAELIRLVGAAPLDARAEGWPRYRQALVERLEQLVGLEEDPTTAAVPATFRRFLLSLDMSPGFLGGLLAAVDRKVREGDEEWLKPARAIFCEEQAIYIDVAREPELTRDASDSRQVAAVSKTLQESRASAGASKRQSGEMCALMGASVRLLEGNFPQPNLPGLGQTYLFARNRDIPAMARYGRNGAGSLPIDADLAGRLSGAVLEVTAQERKGKTWRLQPAETGDKADLLIAYVATALDQPLAAALGTEIEDDGAGEADVEAAAGALLAIFDGIAATAQPNAEARILMLRAVDPANRKAVYEGRTTVRRLHEAARNWARAMLNAPEWVRWPVFVKDKQALRGPSPLPPLSLTELSKRQALRDIRERVDAPGVAAADSMALFLGAGDRARRAGAVLHLLLARQGEQVSWLAHAKTRGQFKSFDPKASRRRDGLRSIAWMGALLYFLGRPKETYMNDAGFKLGQLLAAADAIHMGYCADVRGGDVPPTLIGNSVFATAGRDPLRALDVLQTRWRPYGAWARRSDQVRERADRTTPDKLAWAMRRGVSQARLASQLCEDLHSQLKAMVGPPDERFRAELLLGYVAGLKSEPKTDETNAAAGEETTA